MARSKNNPDMIRTNAMISGNTYGMGDIGKKAEGKRPVRFDGLYYEGEKVAAFPKMKELTTGHTLRVIRLDTETPEPVELHLNAKEPIFCLDAEKKGTRQTFTTWKGEITPFAEPVTEAPKADAEPTPEAEETAQAEAPKDRKRTRRRGKPAPVEVEEVTA